MRSGVTAGCLWLALVVTFGVGAASAADPAATFPKGPYGVTQALGTLLQPATFGVPAGQPVADVTAQVLSDGRLRAYVFAQGQGIVTALSSDGKTFTAEGSAFGRDAAFGQPRVIKLANGTYRMFANGGGGIQSASSADGKSFTADSGTRISSSAAGEAALSGPGIVRLADGRYRAYFSGLGTPGSGPKPLKVQSAVSTDLTTWTVEAGVRVGAGAALSGSAEHPTVVTHADGTVTLFYFRNTDGATGLWTATSSDGLTFGDEEKLRLPGEPMDGNDPEVFLDASGRMIVWYGGFDHTVGGTVMGAVLGPAAQSIVSATQSSAQPTGSAVKPPPVTKKSVVQKKTITCVKGKVTKRVTGTKPKCPTGYKQKK